MNPKEVFKNRPSIDEARPAIVNFFEQQKVIYVGINGNEGLPVIDTMDYFYFKEEHIAVIPPVSKMAKEINDKSTFSAFIQEGVGKGSKKFYGDLSCSIIGSDETILDELETQNPMIKKMRSHGAKFLKLNMLKATISLSMAEIYSIDNDLNPTFAKFTPSGRERFENSRQVLMTYLDREVIFNVIIEEGMYYCLAKRDSNKIAHIKEGGICKIYDGKDNHFDTTIKIIEHKTDEIFEKLKVTNNSYFKENKGLTALCFTKSI